ncbi:MAG: PAS domain S-box protein [bacterium]|nr:MAG: PAS domain S-box protein [bacterium]
MPIPESRTSFIDFIEKTGPAFVILDRTGAFRYFNERFARLFGYSRDEMKARAIDTIVQSEDVDSVISIHGRCLNGEDPMSRHEFRGIKKDGSIVDLEIDIYALKEDGRITGTQVFLWDITERIRIEENIRSIEHEQAMILDTLAEHVIYYQGDDMRIIRANKAAADSLGLSIGDLIGKRCYDLWHHRSEPCNDCPIVEVFKTHKPVEREVISPDGRNWLIKGYPVFGEENVLRGAVEITMDITEKRRAEESLRESEEKYRNVVEHASDGIVIAQGDTLMFANSKASEILGYPAEELIGMMWEKLVPADVRDISLKRYDRLMEGVEDEQRYELTVPDSKGEQKLLDVYVNKTSLEGDPAIIIFFRDITKQRRLEEEIQKAEQLESIGILAGGIAHDFNNILTAILGNITLATKQTGGNKSLREALCDAEKATLRARDLTQQLLTFSKGGEPIKAIASLGELIHESASFALRGSNVSCEYMLPNTLWNSNIDKAQVSQVIHNLVINAVQAMPGGGTIFVAAENITIGNKNIINLEPGNYIKVSVRDKGIGIAPEYIEHVFDPYFTTKKRGSGLGLAVSYSIIKKHHGHITLESELNKGTTFYIYLPATHEEITVTPFEHHEEFIKHQGRILLMDDEEIVRKVAKRIIEEIGFTVVTASDGAETIELFSASKEKGNHFDAIIMDLTIPGGMGGLETIRKLREIDREVRVIVSSGYSNDPVLANYAEYGFNGYIPKPYKLGEMRSALSKVLSDKH